LSAREDPADHFIVATARVFDLTLVTADEGLLESRAIRKPGYLLTKYTIS
jgi:hypothetical protein